MQVCAKPFFMQAFLIFLTTILLAVEVSARTTELVDPSPIDLSTGLTPEQVNSAISSAIAQKGWAVTKIVSNSPRVVEAEYRIRAHTLAINIEIQPNAVKMAYARSDNLNYKLNRKNQAMIHPNYMVWSQQLADQIRINLSTVSGLMPTSKQLSNTLNASAASSREPFSVYGSFRFEPTELAASLAGEPTAQRTAVNLDKAIETAFKPKLAMWNKPGNNRALLVKSKIVSLRFIGGATRVFAGAMAGRSNITVDYEFVDMATSKTVAKKTIQRTAERVNGFTLARRDYAMVEDTGRDVIDYIDQNYNAVTDVAAP